MPENEKEMTREELVATLGQITEAHGKAQARIAELEAGAGAAVDAAKAEAAKIIEAAKTEAAKLAAATKAESDRVLAETKRTFQRGHEMAVGFVAVAQERLKQLEESYAKHGH